jgi:superfamily II DNA or RNA helicase
MGRLERMKLLPHQQRIVDLNPTKILLDWSPRAGKSLPASIWIDKPEQVGNTYIICKKSNKKEWQSYGTKAMVLTKEEFKKTTIKNPTALVIDEIHNYGAPLFVKGRSALATTLYNLLRAYPNCHVMGLSGSMVRNSPWSFHTLLCYIGVYISWKEWRNEFFELKRMPFLRFPAYFPKKDWRNGVYKYRRKYCDQVSLHDVVEYLPPVKPTVIKIIQPKYTLPTNEIVTWVHEHKHEQKNKDKWISELEYKKIIIVCRYTEQINTLAEKLREYKDVFILNGHTKDQGSIIKQAQESEECYFIVNSKMGEAWSGYMFDIMVFASMDDAFTANFQMHERQRDINNLRDIEIIYLTGGRWDEKILKSYQMGEDFNPHHYIANGIRV